MNSVTVNDHSNDQTEQPHREDENGKDEEECRGHLITVHGVVHDICESIGTDNHKHHLHCNEYIIKTDGIPGLDLLVEESRYEPQNCMEFSKMSVGSSGLVQTQCLLRDDLNDCTPIMAIKTQKTNRTKDGPAAWCPALRRDFRISRVPWVRFNNLKILRHIKDRKIIHP
ncbi:hypothetical protein OGAPHI_000064 [Ogataea philodendri]|uniref:Uncharacterized protein n=1 Tax=Ogataea philodendri TaxID=1378263 RepID=A0A9P8PGJ5_9ASCO|nr:uncharacterized protein OGAPHI_000064 [Ogataea philodendri]KAH3671878.1 hypothetical protein OGAPHI_000064 [Ogataea philodendri]